MKIKYFPSDDMLHISIGPNPGAYQEGRDTTDKDVTFHYDENERIVEIEIAHASKRINLNSIRRQYSFEEVAENEPEPARRGS